MFKFDLLRFSGFNDEWESYKFDDLFNFQVAGDMKKELFNDELTDEFKYPLYANALENEGLLGYYKDYKYESNSITVTARGNIGYATVRKNKFSAIGRLIILTAKINLNMNFFEEYINNNVKVHIESTGVPQLTAPSLKINKINYPNLNEQNKISNFLTRLNKKIELLEKKHQCYQDFKKYLMQQIFTQKLRFNFIDDWDVVKLETLIEKGKAGGTPPSTNPDYYNGEIPFLSIKDMTEQGKYIVKTEKSITEEGLNNSSAWIIPKYSLLYSIYASIGLVSINLTEVSTSQAIYGIILKEGVSLEYMYYYLTYFKKNIHRYVETGTQGNLNAKLLKSFEIALPSVDEQEMIVNILSLVDKKIENMEKEVGKMNEFKKGLLQQMFI